MVRQLSAYDRRVAALVEQAERVLAASGPLTIHQLLDRFAPEGPDDGPYRAFSQSLAPRLRSDGRFVHDRATRRWDIRRTAAQPADTAKEEPRDAGRTVAPPRVVICSPLPPGFREARGPM